MSSSANPGSAVSGRLGTTRSAPGQTVALVAFVALLPGHFIYHALVAEGMPAFLRGYSVLAAAMTLPLIALGSLHALAAGRRTVWMDAAFLAFVSMMVAVATAGAATGASSAIVGAHLGAALQWIALFGIARLVGLDDRRTRQVITISWLMMSAIVLANVSEGAFLVAALDVQLNDRDTLATYQDFALPYLITSVLLLATVRSTWRRMMVFLVATVVLFVNGARSEFLALLVASMLIAWCLTRRRVVLVVVAISIVVAAALAVDLVTGLVPDNRVVDLIENQAEGTLSERRDMLDQAWSTLAANPFTGNYASYAPGEYAHNIVSAWVDLGLMGIAGLSLLLLLPLIDLSIQLRRRSHDPGYVVAITLIVLSLLLLLTVKAFTYNLVPFALGAYARDLTRRAVRDSQS